LDKLIDTSIQKYELAIPDPKNLIHALRDIGYSLETALADVIDNSITAEASEVNIYISFDVKDSNIAIVDNGKGMNINELTDAMNLGSFDPLAVRNKKDLGRFGLGLKTASFSQSSKLTVVSRQNSNLISRCWDLDHVSNTKSWEVAVYDETQIKQLPQINHLSTKGTLVLWEKLDRLIDTSSKRSPEDIFWEKIDIAREHLGLVFHRYITGEAGLKKLAIFINGDPIVAFNPFEGAGKHFPEEEIGKIKMQAYLLPHQNKTTVEKYKQLASKDGYVKSQGFYVYRNSRLMIHGTWFRLAKQSEATKLARVKIDLPNSEDFTWSIDVKKSRATPPESIRTELKRTIEKIMTSSTRVYKSRGARISKKGFTPIWSEYHQHNDKSYRLNYDSPIIESLLSSLNDTDSKKVKELFSIIESTLPIDSIFADLSTEPENIKQNLVTDDQLVKYAEDYWLLMSSMGNDKNDISLKLKQTEPFSKFEEFCDQFIERKNKEK
jgi:hypothetical protein